MEQFIELIPTLGFPIVCVIALACFVVYIFNNNNEQVKDWMDKVEKSCDKREEKLYQEITENRMINQKAIETIASFADKIGVIQEDVRDIKEDLIEIKSQK